MNESIMPLVEENRQLHDKVRALEFLLAEQNVRMDKILEDPNFYRGSAMINGLVRIDVTLPFTSFLEPGRVMLNVSNAISDKLVEHYSKVLRQATSKGLELSVSFWILETK